MNQTILGSLAAFGASFLTYAFGGWSELLGFFLVAVAIDYVTGVAASLKEKSGLNSNIGFWGLAKKGLMLLIILLGHRMDMLIGGSVVMNAAIYFYLVNELISITENYGRLGLPLPDKIKEVIAQLKNSKQDKN
ncbi:holin family protein [Paenibacillus sp. 1P03SA]|uniref:phage holin family protein n=1 Tax=Paenibacillus sp. 1P03SA TaxID=3132294 RepID=UPI0039A278ED